MIIKEGNVIDIIKKEIYPARISLIEKIIQKVERVDKEAKNFIMPGLIDAHIHIESSLVTPSSFAEQAVSRGTTSVISDPHEIANVLGIEGIKFMLEDAEKVPLKFWFGAPSCVPATQFESAGATIDASDIEKLLALDKIKYLAEIMNYPGVINDDPEVHRKIKAAIKAGKPIDGHAPLLTGRDLRKYVESGITTDHECTSITEALEKIRLGMKILIREGSAARNLSALKNLIRTHPDMVMLCSDDMHPETLIKRHLDKIISELLYEGYDLFNVIKCCTMNPAQHYSIPAGLLQEGQPADFVILDNYHEMNILETWIEGEKVYDRGKILFQYKKGKQVNNFQASSVTEQQLEIKKSGNKIRVIEASDGELLTKELILDTGKGKRFETNVKKDILKIVVKDRYNDKAPSVAFIKGFGLRRGAIASSVAHDSHNIICVGTNDTDIALAMNKIIEMKGGLSVAYDNSVEILPLPVAGIMTEMPLKWVAGEYEKLSNRVKYLGSKLTSPFMTLSFMALLVIPEIKLSDKGLFNGTKFAFVPLFTD
jgi:adenine deaminase